VDHLYIPQKKGGRRLKFAIELEQRNLSFYIHQSDDESFCLKIHYAEHGKQYKLSYNMECLQTWKDKSLHGQFLLETEEQVSVKLQWLWLQHGNLTKEMEGLVLATQEQALSTNAIRAHIFNIQSSAKCWLCGISDKMVDHLFCADTERIKT